MFNVVISENIADTKSIRNSKIQFSDYRYKGKIIGEIDKENYSSINEKEEDDQSTFDNILLEQDLNNRSYSTISSAIS